MKERNREGTETRGVRHHSCNCLLAQLCSGRGTFLGSEGGCGVKASRQAGDGQGRGGRQVASAVTAGWEKAMRRGPEGSSPPPSVTGSSSSHCWWKSCSDPPGDGQPRCWKPVLCCAKRTGSGLDRLSLEQVTASDAGAIPFPSHRRQGGKQGPGAAAGPHCPSHGNRVLLSEGAPSPQRPSRLPAVPSTGTEFFAASAPRSS